MPGNWLASFIAPISWKRLKRRKRAPVAPFAQKEIATVDPSETFAKVLEKLNEDAVVGVVGANGVFKGLLTRQSLAEHVRSRRRRLIGDFPGMGLERGKPEDPMRAPLRRRGETGTIFSFGLAKPDWRLELGRAR